MLTLVLLVLLEVQQSLGPLVLPNPRSDLVYQDIPSAPAPPSLLSEGRGHRSTLLLETATTGRHITTSLLTCRCV